MKLFFDFEFTGLHQGTTPISLGIISEDDRTFYAEFCDYDEAQVDGWIKENVVRHLCLEPSQAPGLPLITFDDKENKWITIWGNKEQVRWVLSDWLGQFDYIEMVGDCLSYDWMLFCELFDGALNLPSNVCYIPIDLATMFKCRGIDPDINREEFAGLEGEQKHNALWDAKVIRACYQRLKDDMGIELEAHADLEHEIWSSWMRYMFSAGTFLDDGTWSMPAWAVERWQKQMRTPYVELSEQEKESDREQVRKHIHLIKTGEIDRAKLIQNSVK